MTTKIPAELSSTPGIIDSSNATAITIDSSENIGIGTTSPVRPLHVHGASSGDIVFAMTNNSTGATTSDGFNIIIEGPTPDVLLRNRENSNMRFLTNNTERVRIDSSGALLVGKTADNVTDSGFVLKKRDPSGHAQLFCSGTASSSVETYYVYDTSNSEFEFFVSYAGAVNYRSLVSLSDERKKDNIADITFGLDAIKELRPVSFDWKNNKGNDQLGFLAQEVETTSLKQLVSTYKDENIEDCKSLNKEQMIPVLVKAIQEQQDIIDDLKSRIETLEE